MHDYLQNILASKQQELAQLVAQIAADSDHPINKILAGDYPRKIKKTLRAALMQLPVAIIAEIKRRSPSKDALAEISDPVTLAYQYISGGAAAISVLTDYPGFGGHLSDLIAVTQALADSPVPVLRKDFILDEIQIAESIAAGADAILLIVSILENDTERLLAAARRMQIDALVEVHTLNELDYALRIGADLIGINNRNLTNFKVDLNCSRTFIHHLPPTIIKVAESGIESPEVGAELAMLGFNGLLIGESLVKSSSPATFIHTLQQRLSQLKGAV